MPFIIAWNRNRLTNISIFFAVIPLGLMFSPWGYVYSKISVPRPYPREIPKYLTYAGLGKEISKQYMKILDNKGNSKIFRLRKH